MDVTIIAKKKHLALNINKHYAMYLCRSHYLDFLYRKFSLSAVCPATPLLKAVEEDLNSPGADTKNLDTVEQIVEAFNLEVGGCVI